MKETENTSVKHRAYVIGGELKFVKGTLARRLAAHGISVDWTFDWDQSRQQLGSLPNGCTLVLCLKDMIGHRMRDPAHKLAKKAGIPAYDIQRKWCQAAQTLLSAGVIESVHPEDIEDDDMPAKQYYEDLTAIREYVATLKGRRPSITEVSEAIGVEPGFLGMLRGINEGIALAQAATAKRSSKARKKEMKKLEELQALEHAKDLCIMTFEDDPRLLLDLPSALKFVQSCFSAPPPNSKQLKEFITEAATLCRESFKLGTKRGRRKPEDEEAYKRLNHMRLKLAQHYYAETEAKGKTPKRTGLQNVAERLFGSKIPKSILDEVFKSKSGAQQEPPVEKVDLSTIETNTQDILLFGHLMGKMTDSDAAKEISKDMGKRILAVEVTHVREELGIEAFVAGETQEPDVMTDEGTAEDMLSEIGIEAPAMPVDDTDDIEALDEALETALDESLAETAPEEDVEDAVFEVTDPDPGIDNLPTAAHDEPNVVALKVVQGDDQAAVIGNAIATLIRAGCTVNISVQTPGGEETPMGGVQ